MYYFLSNNHYLIYWIAFHLMYIYILDNLLLYMLLLIYNFLLYVILDYMMPHTSLLLVILLHNLLLNYHNTLSID